MYSKEPSLKKHINEAKECSYQMQYIYKEFVDNFAKTIHKKETKKLIEMIENALIIVEKTVGYSVELKGNYRETELIMNCFPTSVGLAFRAIIHNAVKFSGGLPEKERYLQISVNADKRNNYVNIIFESSTIDPLTEDKLKMISNKPLERVIKREFGGGLGLKLADLCVKLNFGEIKAENVNGEKAVRFIINLPINIDQKIGDLK